MRVMKAIKALSKIYYASVKRNRLASTSVASDHQHVEALTWRHTETIQGKLVYIKKLPKGHEVVPAGIRLRRTEYVGTNDLSQSDVDATQQVCRICVNLV